MSITRKVRRAKKKVAEKQMAKTLGLFEKIPSNCLSCEKPYDKANKEHVTSWSVTVRESEGKVNLYCPTCWEGAKKFLNELAEEINEKSGT
ncbi:hypothetical protein N9989_00535 [bacterium]|jgi:hypothetical protein|nr:hypothetical protein [bacterium]